MLVFLSLLLLWSPAHAADTGGTASYEQAGTTSAPEKAKFAAEAASEIQGHIDHVNQLIEAAQKAHQQDVVECLSRKLQPMETLAGAVKIDSAALTADLAQGGTEADALFRKIAVALSKVRDFRADADACAGDAGADRGNSVSSMSEPDSLVDVESLIDNPWEEDDNIERDPSPN